MGHVMGHVGRGALLLFSLFKRAQHRSGAAAAR
jgi:hypothetical protein